MIVEVKNLSKTFISKKQKTVALKDLNFIIKKNSIVGVAGNNGAGKTTLFKILAGITPGYRGKVRIFDHTPGLKTQRRTGFLPENPEFIHNLTVYETLKLSVTLGSDNTKKDIESALRTAGLLKHRDKKTIFLSKGMKQRLGIAAVMINDPDLIIFDEPLSGLDSTAQKNIIDSLKRLHRQGKTIIFSTHNLSSIETLCTDLILMDRGEIKLSCSTSDMYREVKYRIHTSGKSDNIVTCISRNKLDDELGKLKEKEQTPVRIEPMLSEYFEGFCNKDE